VISEAGDLACAPGARRLGIDPEPVDPERTRMSPAGRFPSDEEIEEMHRILLKVAAHEMPSAEEITFLREIKVEVFERFNGPSMRVDLPDADEPA
jgi:hypothetical protein